MLQVLTEIEATLEIPARDSKEAGERKTRLRARVHPEDVMSNKAKKMRPLDAMAEPSGGKAEKLKALEAVGLDGANKTVESRPKPVSKKKKTKKKKKSL